MHTAAVIEFIVLLHMEEGQQMFSTVVFRHKTKESRERKSNNGAEQEQKISEEIKTIIVSDKNKKLKNKMMVV